MRNWRVAAETVRKRAVLAPLRPTGPSAVLVLLLSVPVLAEPHVPGYASEKVGSAARTSRASVHLALPPDEWPHRGMLVATGNVLSPLARWIVIDLDLMAIRQATTRLAVRGGPVEIESERTDAILDDEWRDVIASANEVWSMPDFDPPALGEPTDRLCSVALFDGDDVLHEVGSDCPRPRFVALLEALAASAERRARLQERAPAPPSAPAPIGSAHREPDGTLVLWLRAESEDGSVVGHGELRYPPSHPDYDRVLRHLGPIPPGGAVLVQPFPPRWPDELAPPQRPRS
ncbi:hypothetical protein ACLNGM_21720 [Aureimonas phyllosphaerae]|uniref:hypothetical protein n=1 Tax=Aureimonas phyllosphaerae TaxID=1166078 RepID=UPI003A5BFF4B